MLLMGNTYANASNKKKHHMQKGYVEMCGVGMCINLIRAKRLASVQDG
jgi:hypothetical protein